MPRLIDKKFLPFFTKNGVPPGVLFANFAVDFQQTLVAATVEIHGKPLSFSAKKQRDTIPRILGPTKPYLAIMGGENHDAVAAQVALQACVEATRNNASHPFYWHVLTGSTTDSLRDNEVNYEERKNTKLLVISGIAQNSTAMKVEKLRDLLTLFSNVPRIVVLSGGDALDYCYTTLYVKPNYLLQFGSKEINND